MTEFDDDLAAHLLGESPSPIGARIFDAAAAENRLYPLERPAGQKNLDALVYTVIHGAPEQDLENDQARTDLENVLLQIDVWSATHDGARSLAKLVRSRMETPAVNGSIRAVLQRRQSDLDQDTRERRELLEFSVWHTPQ